MSRTKTWRGFNMRRKSKKIDLHEYTLQEIADELGVTPCRVKQLLSSALSKIQSDPEHEGILREYWKWSTERRQAEGYVARYGIRV